MASFAQVPFGTSLVFTADEFTKIVMLGSYGKGRQLKPLSNAAGALTNRTYVRLMTQLIRRRLPTLWPESRRPRPACGGAAASTGRLMPRLVTCSMTGTHAADEA